MTLGKKRIRRDYTVKELLKKYDLDKDGNVTENEITIIERLFDVEAKIAQEKDRDMREDTQRTMAWFSLFGMLFYPFAVVLASWLGLDEGANILGTMASIYFVSVAAIVAAFFGAQAYTNSHGMYSSNNNTNGNQYY